MGEILIPTYVVNLKNRVDRQKHILAQFKDRPEFKVSIIHPVIHENGAFSLWLTLKRIIEHAYGNNDELIILCEDDHQFEKAYSLDHLLSCIKIAQQYSCEVLSGGVSCVKSSFQVSDGVYWIEEFTGLQFTIIFRKFFKKIIEYDFCIGDDADIVISRLAKVKMVIYPFMSTQKEFGYSDVTSRNATAGHVKNLFQESSERIAAMKLVLDHYNSGSLSLEESIDWDSVYIPLYLVYKNKTDLDQCITEQFNGRKEFEIRIKKEISPSSIDYITQIKKMVEEAIDADEDIFIFCKSSHVFSENYSKYSFLKNILEANAQGADLLLGGLKGFDCVLPISTDRFWIMSFINSDFIVIYKKMFAKLLTETISKVNPAVHPLSEMTSHKMLIYPLISVEQDSTYSRFNSNNSQLLVGETEKKLEDIRFAFAKMYKHLSTNK